MNTDVQKMECELEDLKQEELEELFRFVDEISTAFYRAVKQRKAEKAREKEALKREYAFLAYIALAFLLLFVAAGMTGH